MDLSDVGIRHNVAFSTINICHTVDVSPSAVSLAKEFRYCILFVVIGITSVSIVRSVLSWKSAAAEDQSDPAHEH